MRRRPKPRSIPHYLRFARAIALTGALSGAAGCCPVVPDAVVCGHCACRWDVRSVSRPLACTTLHRDGPCCPPPITAPFVGPLPPPSLAA